MIKTSGRTPLLLADTRDHHQIGESRVSTAYPVHCDRARRLKTLRKGLDTADQPAVGSGVDALLSSRAV